MVCIENRLPEVIKSICSHNMFCTIKFIVALWGLGIFDCKKQEYKINFIFRINDCGIL